MSYYINPENQLTPANSESMERSIRALEDHGFTFDSWIEDDQGRCALYTFKPQPWITMFAEVDPTGAVNTQPLNSYLLRNQVFLLMQ
jgi:hypothetical protein